jgi:hypothetical protein
MLIIRKKTIKVLTGSWYKNRFEIHSPLLFGIYVIKRSFSYALKSYQLNYRLESEFKD